MKSLNAIDINNEEFVTLVIGPASLTGIIKGYVSYAFKSFNEISPKFEMVFLDIVTEYWRWN